MGQCADLNGRQTMAYVEVVSTAVLLFDFCITFDSEVRWTWGRKWEIMRIAFVISRYLPIASVAMYLYYNVQSLQRGIPNPGMFIAVDGTMTTLGSAAADGQYQPQVKSLYPREFFSSAACRKDICVLWWRKEDFDRNIIIWNGHNGSYANSYNYGRESIRKSSVWRMGRTTKHHLRFAHNLSACVNVPDTLQTLQISPNGERSIGHY